MNPESLRALLVDRELGELAPDVVELLDAYVAIVPAAQAEVATTASLVSTVRDTIRRYPELAPTVETEAEVIPRFVWLARAAALVALVALAGWLGYRAGNHSLRVGPPVVTAPATDHRFDGVWTRYQVAYDSRQGAYTVEERKP